MPCLPFSFIAYKVRSQLGEFTVMMSWHDICLHSAHCIWKFFGSNVPSLHKELNVSHMGLWLKPEKSFKHLEISSCLLVFHILEMRRRPELICFAALVNLVTLPFPSGIPALSLSTFFYFTTRYKFNRQISEDEDLSNNKTFRDTSHFYTY